MNLWPRTLSGRLWENDGRGEACLPQRAGRDSTAHGAPAAMIPRPVKLAFAAKRDWLTLVVPWAKGPRYNKAGETWQNA